MSQLISSLIFVILLTSCGHKSVKFNSVGPKEEIVQNKELSIWEALIPVFALIIMLFYNVFFAFGDDALSGSNQFLLLCGAGVAMIVGFFNTHNQIRLVLI